MSEKSKYIESLILKELGRRKGLIAGTSLLGLGMLAYSYLKEPHWLEVTRHTVTIKGLPAEWRGFRLAWLSDIHLQPDEAIPAATRQAFEIVAAEKPDLAILGGDMFDKGAWVEAAGSLFGSLPKAGVQTLAIMGNHDYYSNRGEPLRTARELKALGIKLLVNEATCIERGGIAEWVIGIDDLAKGVPDLPEATRKIPPGVKPLLYLAHNPKLINLLPPDYCILTLSGHTHGGQINPALPPFHRRLNWVQWAKGDMSGPFPQGWYTHNGNKLYVGRGLGTTRWPVRFNARPELPIFEFTAE